jgi:ribosomal protein S18 acetylase RimI-like enzyme
MSGGGRERAASSQPNGGLSGDRSRRSQAHLAIRLADIADAEAIHAAIRKIGAHLGTAHRITSTPEDICRFGFGADARFTTLIAEIGGDFAGMCLFFPSFSTWRGEPGAYIQDIFVEARFRGRGVGEALVRATARHVRAQGGAYLRLSVDSGNESAKRFYESLGMIWSRDEHIHAAYGDAFGALAGPETP